MAEENSKPAALKPKAAAPGTLFNFCSTRPGRLLGGGSTGGRRASFFRRGVPGFDGLDGVFKGLFQNAPVDGPEHQAAHPSLEVLAVADDDDVNVGHAVGLTREGVGVARRASP